MAMIGRIQCRFLRSLAKEIHADYSTVGSVRKTDISQKNMPHASVEICFFDLLILPIEMILSAWRGDGYGSVHASVLMFRCVA